VIQTDLQILKRFGILRTYLQKQGNILADADIFIAATTIEKGNKLITGNINHFERIPGLLVESWI
ncbi:MAG: type II toxin-antitoxin system VapC family toxin, partial [Spirochaetota bacterium]